ncbi:MAG: hypothetical protein ACOX2L_00885 [Anaerolineae bacterium]|jgi:hypothetical protein|nr:hypothetical protein [Chloroflexota bacterium]
MPIPASAMSAAQPRPSRAAGEPALRWLHPLALLVLVALLAAFTWRANAGAYHSDPRLNLITSQAILEHHTIALDAYAESGILGEPLSAFVERKHAVFLRGHTYDFYPTLPAVLSLPEVATARAQGLDMRVPEDVRAVQRVLATTTVTGILLLLYRLSRRRVGPWASLLLTAIFVIASPITSTLTTALWTANYALLFILATLLILTRHAPGELRRGEALAVGLLLFATWATRASTATFVAAILLYLLLRERRRLPAVALVAGPLLILFVLWSRHTYGLWLPPYYGLGGHATARTAPIWVGLYGQLLSPSRGWFVYLPYLLPVVAAMVARPRVALREPLARIVPLWTLLMMLSSAYFVGWWSGMAFGPRLHAELVPGWLLLTATAWRNLSPQLTVCRRRIAVGSFTLLGLLAMLIHLSPFFNPTARFWNRTTYRLPAASERGLGDLFRWDYFQPLSSGAMLCRIERDHGRLLLPLDATLAPYAWGTALHGDADLAVDWRTLARTSDGSSGQPAPQDPTATNQALLIGWGEYLPEHARWLQVRWTTCSPASIVLGPVMSDAWDVQLTLTVASPRAQRLEVAVNGIPLEEQSLLGGDAPQTLTWQLPAGTLRTEERNTLVLQLPDSPEPGFRLSWRADPLPGALALHELVLTPVPWQMKVSRPLQAPGSPAGSLRLRR